MQRLDHQHMQKSSRRQNVFDVNMLYVDRLAEKCSKIAMERIMKRHLKRIRLQKETAIDVTTYI